MSRQRGRANDGRRSRRPTGRAAGTAAVTGVFLALGITPATAHADLEDLIIQPIMDALDHTVTAVDPGLASLDPGVDAGSVLGALSAETAKIPLSMDSTSPAQGSFTVPMVNLSVGGGESVPVEVDTGSNGLVLPVSDVPFWSLFQSPAGFGTAEYEGNAQGALNIFYEKLPETVDFTTTTGQTIADKTDVDVVLFSWPQHWSFMPGTVWSFQQMMSVNEGDQNGGILGIGPDALGPNTGAPPTAGLPGDLGQGVLIDENGGQPGGYLQFGPAPTDLGKGVTVDGVDNTTLGVKIGDGPIEPVNKSFLDSGGGYGVIGSNVLPPGLLNEAPVGNQLPAGTPISVYNSDGDLLYSYTTGQVDSSGLYPFPLTFNNGPMVVGPATASMPIQFNTGYEAYQHGPVYIGDADGGSATYYPGAG